MSLFVAGAVAVLLSGAAAPPPKVPRDTQPWWSPRGTTIAFERVAPTFETGHVLFTPSVRGTEGDVLGEGKPRGFRPESGELLVEHGAVTSVRDAAAHDLGTIPGTDAAWSPDGARVAFLQDGGVLAVAAADGSNIQTIASGIEPPLADITGPVWSPDGTAIAVATGSTIEIVPLDGTEPDVAFDQPGDNVNPSWSRDGAAVAFERFANGRWSVWLVGPDGTNAREAFASSGNSRFPQWSPVDERLAFISDRGGQYALYVGVVGGQAQALLQALPPDAPARWSPNGVSLAVASAVDCRRFGIYVVGATAVQRRSNQCRFDGSPGGDVLQGTPYYDVIDGHSGNDRLFSGNGDDVVYGSVGNDGIGGGPGNDLVYGGVGDDILSGGTGNDVIRGGPGHDRVGCGPGVDTVYLGAGDTSRDCERIRRIGR